MSERTRILIIDDDTIVADSLVEFFHQEGYCAVAAYTPSQATTLLKEAADDPAGVFQVAICDINLPEIGGIELLR